MQTEVTFETIPPLGYCIICFGPEYVLQVEPHRAIKASWTMKRHNAQAFTSEPAARTWWAELVLSGEVPEQLPSFEHLINQPLSPP